MASQGRWSSLAEAPWHRQGQPDTPAHFRPSAASGPQPLPALSRFPPAPSRLGQPPLASFVGHPDAQACIKSAYVNGGEVFVTKVGGPSG